MGDLLQSHFIRQLIWHSVLLPAAITLVAGLITITFTFRSPTSVLARILWSLTFLLGMLSGYFAVYHDWFLWPRTVLSWLPILAIGTLVLTAWATYSKKVSRRFLLIPIVVTFSTGILLWPIFKQITLEAAFYQWLVVTLLWWSAWTIYSSSGHKQIGFGICETILAAGLAATGPLAQSIMLGQLGLILTTSWVMVIFISRISPSNHLLSLCNSLGMLFLGILMIELWAYAAAPWPVIMWYLIAVFLGGISNRWAQSTLHARQWPTLLVPATLTLIPVVIGIYTAWETYRTSSGGY